MALHILTPPTAEPLDIAAVRHHLKVDVTDDDAMIGLYLLAAREYAEHETGRQLVAARFRQVLDEFPGRGYGRFDCRQKIRLSVGPLIQVEAIKYVDPDGNIQTLAPSEYVVSESSDPPTISPAANGAWPVALRQIGAVWIEFRAGHCAQFTADTVAGTIAVDGWKTLAAGDQIRLSNSGGELPKPLKPKVYYIKTVEAPGVYTLSATEDGTAITLATAGTGTHYMGQPSIGGGVIPPQIAAWMLLRADSHFSHRGENAVVRGGKLEPLAFADRLLDAHRMPRI